MKLASAALGYDEAVAIQERLRQRLETKPRLGKVSLVAGVDVGVRGEIATAAVVVMSFPDLRLIEAARHSRPVAFPYIPGLLAFREVPVIEAAFAELRHDPDLLLVDGHGYAHPRRFGLACHLGVVLDKPSIGVGKTLFVGEHRQPGARRGARAVLRALTAEGGETIGCALRTRQGVKPIYVSIGHRVDLATAVRFVLACTTRFRLPEPIRAAHQAAATLEIQGQ